MNPSLDSKQVEPHGQALTCKEIGHVTFKWFGKTRKQNIPHRESFEWESFILTDECRYNRILTIPSRQLSEGKGEHPFIKYE